MTLVNGLTITPTTRGYEVRDRGALQGVFSSMGLAFSYAEGLTPTPEGLCPNCGKKTAHSSFYGGEYCYHCHTRPENYAGVEYLKIADEVL